MKGNFHVQFRSSRRGSDPLPDCNCASTDARVHYLRDIHKLKDKYPDDEEVWRWAKAVKDVYDQAVAWVAQGPGPGWSPHHLQQMRVAQQHVFEQRRMAPSASRTCARPRPSKPMSQTG